MHLSYAVLLGVPSYFPCLPCLTSSSLPLLVPLGRRWDLNSEVLLAVLLLAWPVLLQIA